MKGVFIDENLPAGLQLPTDLPVSHVTAMSESPPDTVVWNHARKRSLVIVTKDADFSHRILTDDPPPWIVHIRFGNLRLRPFIQRLTAVWPSVEALLPKHKLITVFSNGIEAIE
jgi:predicted nuclease of predicted toxin-antitoxin system